MDIQVINENTLRVTKIMPVCIDYSYDYLIEQRDRIIAQKADEISKRDSEIEEIDMLLIQFQNLNMSPELTELEIAQRSWHYKTPKRLIAPKQLLDAYPNVALKMMIRGLQIVEQGDTYIVYINLVSPEDEALVQANSQYITIEDYPV